MGSSIQPFGAIGWCLAWTVALPIRAEVAVRDRALTAMCSGLELLLWLLPGAIGCHWCHWVVP